MSRNIKVTLSYCGTAYSGWQIQDNGPTIQDEVQKAIKELTDETVCVNGSSRTDAGVHANGFVFNFISETTIPDSNFPFALNAFLPKDIVALKAETVSDDFHARFDAHGKTYRYYFYASEFEDTTLLDKAWWIRTSEFKDKSFEFYEKKAKIMNKAASAFVGTHDFGGFMASGSYITETTRTMYTSKVYLIKQSLPHKTPLFCFEISGDGFLYNMVRIMVGTLSFVLMGKISPEEMPDIIISKERKKGGITAPAHGLYLDEVFYS